MTKEPQTSGKDQRTPHLVLTMLHGVVGFILGVVAGTVAVVIVVGTLDIVVGVFKPPAPMHKNHEESFPLSFLVFMAVSGVLGAAIGVKSAGKSFFRNLPCSVRLADGRFVCPHCTSPLAEEPPFCPNCGVRIVYHGPLPPTTVVRVSPNQVAFLVILVILGIIFTFGGCLLRAALSPLGNQAAQKNMPRPEYVRP